MMPRDNLSDDHVVMLEELLHEIFNNKGGLTDDFAKKLYDSGFIVTTTNKAFQEFIMNHVVPNLNEDELFNFTKAIMLAHQKHDEVGSNAASLVRAQGRLSGKLYFAYAEGCHKVTEFPSATSQRNESDQIVTKFLSGISQLDELNQIIVEDWKARGINADDEITKAVNIVFGMRDQVRSMSNESITPHPPHNSLPLLARMNQIANLLSVSPISSNRAQPKIPVPMPSRSVPAPQKQTTTPSPQRPSSGPAIPERPSSGPSIPNRPSSSPLPQTQNTSTTQTPARASSEPKPSRPSVAVFGQKDSASIFSHTNTNDPHQQEVNKSENSPPRPGKGPKK